MSAADRIISNQTPGITARDRDVAAQSQLDENSSPPTKYARWCDYESGTTSNNSQDAGDASSQHNIPPKPDSESQGQGRNTHQQPVLSLSESKVKKEASVWHGADAVAAEAEAAVKDGLLKCESELAGLSNGICKESDADQQSSQQQALQSLRRMAKVGRLRVTVG